MQTTVASGYVPPSELTIKTASDEIGLKIDAPQFIRDVCVMRAEGRFKDAVELEDEINFEQQLHPIKSKIVNREGKKSTVFVRSDKTGKSAHSEFPSYAKAEEALKSEYQGYAEKVRQAITSMPKMDVPGNTPMYQAINLLKLLAEQRNKNKGQGQGGGDSSETSLLDELLDRQNIKDAQDALDSAKNMTDSEKDFLDTISKIKKNGGKSKPEDKGEEGSGGGSGAMSDGTSKEQTKEEKIMQAAIQLSDADLAEAVKISRQLKALTKLRTTIMDEFVVDNNAEEVRNRPMQSFSELGKIKAEQFAMLPTARGLFNYKAVTNQFNIRERGFYSEKKQLLYMLIDCSGSMLDAGHSRTRKAAGVLLNRLFAVSEGEAVLYWRFFDTTVHKCSYVESKDEAFQAISRIISATSYTGGGTNFDNALGQAVAHIETLKREDTNNVLVKPEIMLVTDGECSCHFNLMHMKGIKLHTAFVSDSVCDHVENLARETGGVSIRLGGH